MPRSFRTSVPSDDFLHSRCNLSNLNRLRNQGTQVAVTPRGRLALWVDEVLHDVQRRQDPQWWRYVDLRDDMVDVVRAVKGRSLSFLAFFTVVTIPY